MLKQNFLVSLRKIGNNSILGLAVKAGVSSTIIVGIEKYNYFPGPLVRAKICKALEVAEDQIWPKEAGDRQ